MDCDFQESLNGDCLVLSAKDAACLITKREGLGRLILLSIKGTITALSEVIRLGGAKIFLVEVDTCVTLVIKDFHLEWHSELEPGALFVFHNLRLTTLVQGVSKRCSVLLILATSSFARQTDENAVMPVSLQEWLKQKNMDILLKEETFGHDDNCEKNHGLINYEGTVTSTENASRGIFVLDDRIRLVSFSSNVNLIKKHSRVFIYNAHIIKEGHMPSLVCCMKSCIRIHDPVLSDDVSPTSAGEFENSRGNKVRHLIRCYIRKYNLNFVEITAFLDLLSQLMRLAISHGNQENLISCLVKNCLCTGLVESSVKAADIFIYHSQFCSLNRSQCAIQVIPGCIKQMFQRYALLDNFGHAINGLQQTNGCRIPQIVDLCSLRGEMSQFQSALNSGNSCMAETDIKCQSSPNHLTVCHSNGQVLLGQIIMCPEAMVFKDATGQIQVMILSGSDVCGSDEHPGPGRAKLNSHIQQHQCCQCCFSEILPGAHLTCPILDPWIFGKNICVRRFYTVVESYHCSRTLDSVGSGEECMYLAFSLLDCVLLDKGEKGPLRSVNSSLASPLCSDDLASTSSIHRNLKRGTECDNEFTCLMYVNEKQALTYTGNLFTGVQACEFRILGSIIDIGLETVKVVRCGQSCLKQGKQSEVCVLANSASNQEKSSLPVYSEQNAAQKMFKSICASFSDTSRKWFSCISNGHLYKFTSRLNSNLNPFAPQFSTAKLQKVADNCKARVTIEMPEDLLVERLPLVLSEPYMGLDNALLMQPVSLILSESFPETIVSFCSVIISRDFATSFSSGRNKQDLKSPSVTNIKLEVKEMAPHTNNDSCCGLTVYLDSPRAVYTLGLVPGAVVKFHRVERKVSKIGNIYCKFTAISVAEVVKFSMHDSPSDKFLMSQTHNIALEDMSKEFLINIWHGSRGNQRFLINCHIEKIFQLSIKNVCSSCNSVYLKPVCRSCGCLADPVPASNAILLVEDGTCPATVKIRSSDLIQQLLTLTSNQWQDLLAQVLVHGEVLIDFKCQPSSTIEIFLHTLVGSSLVLRPCKMVVKMSGGSLFSNLDKMSLKDIQENEVKVGRHFLKTLSLPRMQLECLRISDVY